MEAKKWVFIFWLADAIDVSDFNVKLESLYSVWDVLCLSFIHGLQEKKHPYLSFWSSRVRHKIYN